MDLEHEKRLQAALRRRDEECRPMSWDNEVLRAAREKPNLLQPIRPKEPRDGTQTARVLARIRRGPATAKQIAASTRLSPQQARSGISALRGVGWDIRNDDMRANGRYYLYPKR